jgi:signal transduction histidine kinase
MPTRVLAGMTGPVLVVDVADDGCGLPATSQASHGIGLALMQRRAAEVGGICIARERPGGGTQIQAFLPCPPARERVDDGSYPGVDR